MATAAVKERIPEDCFIDARVFSDPQIFAEELEQIFARGWIMLGHECEAKQAGQFFCCEIGGVPVLVCRGVEGQLRGFVDACRVCGETVAMAQWGKRQTFSCAQGHAVYDLAGQAVDNGTGEGLEGIQLDSVFGVVFGSLAPGESLRDYLGELLTWWTSIFPVDAEWELINTYMYPTDANWKAFMQPGDGYHVQALHKIFAKSMLPKGGFYDLRSRVSPAYCHVLFPYPPPDYELFRRNVWGGVVSPEEIEIPRLMNVPEGLGGYVGQAFPNLIYAIRNGWDLFVQLIMPRAPGRTFVYNKIYSRAGLSAEQKRVIQKEEDIWAFPMGLNGQDDQTNFDWQQKALRGNTLPRLVMARHLGEDPHSRTAEVPQDSELGYRSFFRRWHKYMGPETLQATRATPAV